MKNTINIQQPVLNEFCQRNHIQRLSLFGSRSKGTNRPNSDIDLLVEFEPTHIPDFFTLADMEAELSSLLHGRQVELRTPRDLSRYFRDQVLATALVQYAS